MIQMLDTVIDFFSNKRIIITRHPKCNDRELELYINDKLSDYENVWVSKENTLDLLVRCSFVVLCNSSVGWDAILAEKPIILFGKSEYSCVGHSINSVSDLYDLNFDNINKYISGYKEFYYQFWSNNIYKTSDEIVSAIQKYINSYYLKREERITIGSA